MFVYDERLHLKVQALFEDPSAAVPSDFNNLGKDEIGCHELSYIRPLGHSAAFCRNQNCGKLRLNLLVEDGLER